MAEKTTGEREVQELPGVATLIIPENLVQQVVDYIATLNAEDADVSGFMIYPPQWQKPVDATLSGCVFTKLPNDWVCDTDSYHINR